jgi:hypothetical protein
MIENNPIPTKNRILAPGQCINLSNIPIGMNEKDNDPEINTNFFILCIFYFSTHKAFRLRPVFNGRWSPFSIFYFLRINSRSYM